MDFIERLIEEQPPPSSGTELEPDDLRLEAASAATVRGEYLRAAQIAEEVFASGVYDARFLGYLLLGALLARGPASLDLLLRATMIALTKQRLVFTPERRREVLLDTGLHWFLTHVVRQLELSEKLGDGQREAWEQALAEGHLDAMFTTAERLLPVVAELTPRAKSPQPLRRLTELLRQMHHQRSSQGDGRTETPPSGSFVNSTPPPSAPTSQLLDRPAENLELEPEVTAHPLPADLEPERPLRLSKAMGHRSGLPGFATDDTLYASDALLRLATNLQRFGSLLAQGNHLHAAVLGAELRRELKRFDPSIYLPKLVTPFLRQLADSCAELEPYLAQRDSLRFQTLVKLFRADPDGFVSAAHPSVSNFGDDPRPVDDEMDGE